MKNITASSSSFIKILKREVSGSNTEVSSLRCKTIVTDFKGIYRSNFICNIEETVRCTIRYARKLQCFIKHNSYNGDESQIGLAVIAKKKASVIVVSNLRCPCSESTMRCTLLLMF